MEKNNVRKKVPVICRKSVQALIRHKKMNSWGASASTVLFGSSQNAAQRMDSLA